MQLLGFNLKKISAERSPNFKRGPINTNIDFKDVTEEKIEFLKDLEAIKVSFSFIVNYSDPEDKQLNHGQISLEGDVSLSMDKEEAKDILKSWKKKEVSEKFKIPLFNYIIMKCSTKALSMEDELNLPTHMSFPTMRKDTPVQTTNKDQ